MKSLMPQPQNLLGTCLFAVPVWVVIAFLSILFTSLGKLESLERIPALSNLQVRSIPLCRLCDIKSCGCSQREGKAIKRIQDSNSWSGVQSQCGRLRESPSFVLMEKLEAKGAVLDYHDSYLPVVPPTREHAHFNGKQSVQIENAYDLILLSTDHSEYKNFDFSNYSCPLVDTRNCIKKKPQKYYEA